MTILVITATQYKNTPEGNKVFDDRVWKPTVDRSVSPPKKRVVDRGKHSTQLIDIEWEEVEYGW